MSVVFQDPSNDLVLCGSAGRSVSAVDGQGKSKMLKLRCNERAAIQVGP